MDATFWLEVAIFVTTQIGTGVVILRRRAEHDAQLRIDMATRDAKTEADSKNRFDTNERRILEGVKRMDGHDIDIKALTTALAENKVLLATIVERTLHMVKATERIEATLTTKT